MSLVTLTNLTKSYREGSVDRLVLDSINATINKGEIVALLGRSGSGKSTLLNLIGGIDLPSAGDIVISGLSLPSISEQQRTLFRRKHIGFIFQFFNLIPTLTVEENLLLPLELNGSISKARKQAAMELLHQVGLAERRGSFPDRLSGGEQQRIAIARALVHEPQLLLADEPTGNLDSETGQEVITMLDQLVRNLQMTVVLVTHSNEAADIADRVLTISNGQLHESYSEP